MYNYIVDGFNIDDNINECTTNCWRGRDNARGQM